MKRKNILRLIILIAAASLIAYAVILVTGLRQPKQMPNVITHSDTRLVKVASGITGAVDITGTRTPNDTRLFIAAQDGKIYIAESNEEGNKLFLDISDKVLAGGEQGLLGLAFDPYYEDNGHFYVNYTAKSQRGTFNGETVGPGDTVIARYTRSAADKDRADPETELVIMGYDQPEKNHNGGGLVFGPDRMLYIGSGDGGSGGDPHTQHCAYGNGQCLSTYLGKILRINVHEATEQQRYKVPEDNPWAKAIRSKPEIWHTGLRNPWRFSFDRETKDMLIGDVGQGDWEELDLAKAGEKGLNFGWRCYEGSQIYDVGGNTACNDPANFVKPSFEYDHSQGQCSITGGHVYRGEASKGFHGMYVYSDFCSSKIYYLSRPAGQPWKLDQTIETGFPEKSVSSLGEDNAGEPYIALLTGEVYRIEVPR